MKYFIKILLFGSILLTTSCSEQTNKIVVLPTGATLPSLTMLDVNVPTTVPLTKALFFNLRQFGNVEVEQCYLDTTIVRHYQRVVVSLNKIVCSTQEVTLI